MDSSDSTGEEKHSYLVGSGGGREAGCHQVARVLRFFKEVVKEKHQTSAISFSAVYGGDGSHE